MGFDSLPNFLGLQGLGVRVPYIVQRSSCVYWAALDTLIHHLRQRRAEIAAVDLRGEV